MAVLKNRAGVATTTTGTGAVTLGAAITASPFSASWQTFANAGVVNADVIRYLIFDSNGAWEYGPGTYTASGTTLSRPATSMNGTVAGQKSSTGSLLNLSGNAQVFITAVAEDLAPVVDWVNVMNYGAVGNGVADDTAAIQAAIDFAAANRITGVYLPSKPFKITSSLYLDPPDNLRAVPVNTPKYPAFSLTLFGDPNIGNHENSGTRILAAFDNAPCIYVGGGQGMMVKDISLIAQHGLYRANIPSGSIGIAICDGGGGASRCRFENVLVENFRIGFQTGLFGGALCDSNMFVKCTVYNAYLAFWFVESQNFINSIFDAQVVANTGVYCANGGGCHVYGGNWSSPGNVSAGFTISAVSALTASDSTWTFTATIASPDTHIATNYNCYTFETAHYGIVPAEITAWNAGTGAATFRIIYQWQNSNFGAINLKTATDIEAELQACTKVFCTERITVFLGCNISVDGVHIECDQSPVTLVDSLVTFGGNYKVVLTNIFFNTDSAMTWLLPLAGMTDANKARFYAAHTTPFIRVRSSDIHISDSFLGLNEPVPIWTNAGGGCALSVERCEGFEVNVSGAGGPAVDSIDWARACQTDRQYFNKSVPGDPGRGDQLATSGYGGHQVSPHWIYRPAPWCTPNVSAAHYATLTGTLPAISTTTIDYPMIWGGQVYRIGSWYMASLPANFHFASGHHYFTYGQDLTTTNVPGLSWSYKGQSSCLYISSNTMLMMRNGLGIILNDGTTDTLYIVTGTYPSLGYITISGQPPGFISPTVGVKTTVYTGTLIKQQPFAFVSF
jgi:hypothetical protein